MPVDLYIGGAEHATLHLLYARFWHKFLFDLGYVSTPEPFRRLFNQGMVLSRSFQDERGKYYYSNEVELRDGAYFSKQGNHKIHSQIEKMSKSRNNGIAPEDVIEEYGADSLRLYEGFMGPMEESIPWQTEGMSGVRRFLGRVWRLFDMPVSTAATADVSDFSHLDRVLHQTIRKLTEDIENLKLNTAISQLMIFVNEATREEYVPVHMLDAFIRLLAPFAPHLCEELWQRLGHTESIAFAPWPTFDPAKCVADKIAVVVQINGKVRGGVSLPSGALQREAEDAALKDPAVLRHLGNRRIKTTIFVPDRLLNIVVDQ
jgi:leucyl-tRNA synthetase